MLIVYPNGKQENPDPLKYANHRSNKWIRLIFFSLFKNNYGSLYLVKIRE